MRTKPARTIESVEQVTLTECAVLGLLSDRERSGYDLLKTIERSVGFFWTPARSQLYALLPKLVERGLAKARRVEQDKRPDKTLYRITPAGREALRIGLEQASPAVDRNPFELRIFFGEHMQPGAVRRMIEARRDQQQAHLASARGDRAGRRRRRAPLPVPDPARRQGERAGRNPVGRAGAEAPGRRRGMRRTLALAAALFAAAAPAAAHELAYRPSALLPLDSTYRFANGSTVSLAVTPDGGLLYTDLRTGDLRQLDPARRPFRFGPAYLVQRPVRGTIVARGDALTLTDRRPSPGSQTHPSPPAARRLPRCRHPSRRQGDEPGHARAGTRASPSSTARRPPTATALTCSSTSSPRLATSSSPTTSAAWATRAARTSSTRNRGNIQDLAGDAVGALRTLAGRADVDPERLGLFGGSQAGWIIPRAAALSPLVRFAVVTSGPGNVRRASKTRTWASPANGGVEPPPSEAAIRKSLEGVEPSGFDPRPDLDRLVIPTLWLFGREDKTVYVPQSVEILQALDPVPTIESFLVPATSSSTRRTA